MWHIWQAINVSIYSGQTKMKIEKRKCIKVEIILQKWINVISKFDAKRMLISFSRLSREDETLWAHNCDLSRRTYFLQDFHSKMLNVMLMFRNNHTWISFKAKPKKINRMKFLIIYLYVYVDKVSSKRKTNIPYGT